MTALILALWGDEPPEPARLARLAAALPEHELWFAGPAKEAAPPEASWIPSPARWPEAVEALLAHRGARAAPMVVVATDAWLPEGWFTRLAHAAAGASGPVGPLDPNVAELSPLAEAGDASLEALDAACWRLGEGRLLPAGAVSPALSWWPAGSMIENPALLLDRLLAARPGLPFAAGTHPLLAALRDALPGARSAAALPGLDGRPVLLHLLHGWGGGVERFVRDFAGAASGMHHLLLLAQGTKEAPERASLLELREPGLPAPLAVYPLHPPIHGTALAHPAYHAVLAEVCERFGVGAVVVSSLIGHGLEAFALGLSALVIAHDPYPLWPFLHERFEDPNRRFDQSELEERLTEADPWPLPKLDAGRWWRLRQRYLEALERSDARLVAPSAAMAAILARLAPELRRRPLAVIPHGVSPLPAAWRPPSPRPRRRVLILGRIQGGKGERLLAPLLEQLQGSAIEFYLLGAGAAGMRFFGRGGVHVELDYHREALPALVRRIAPDLALIPASVSESFSYTLSELRMLGVPVLATRVGALAERIHDGEDGFLVEPDPEAIARRLRALLADPASLEEAARRARDLESRDPQQMVADYSAVLRPSARPARVVTGAIDAASLGLRLGAARLLHAARERETLLAERRALAAELERRARWAEEQAALAAERLAWAQALKDEGGRLRGERDRMIELAARLEQEQRALAEHLRALDATLAERDATLRACAERLSESERTLARILQSRSWRYTAPLRALGARLRRSRDRLGFRLARGRALLGRLRASLRTRGLLGTLRHALRPRPASAPARPAPVAAPETLELPKRLPCPEQPLASVIIPIYGKLPYTAACLRALAADRDAPAFETIVVDDASPDDSAKQLKGVEGLRLLPQPENRGFIAACNAGAAAARGEFLVFLNNDTEPRPGWIQALLSTFAERSDCGLAGAKLIYPDGRLQEAGGIVFSDGSGWNYGRFGDPADPRYNFLREADYCSGAAIAIRRSLFERLGGFDPRYAPAYYEDTDLAFRVREAGLKVYYQPRAEVVHHEGITSGTDLASGTKRFQAINQEKFRERWREALKRQPPPGSDPERAREHRARLRLLLIDATVPTPDQDSGSLRIVNLMRAAQELGCKVAFIADNRRHEGRYTEALQALGIEAWYAPYAQDPVAFLEREGPRFDAVWISRHYVASAWLPLVRRYAPSARVVFDTVDLHFLRERRLAELSADPMLARQAEQTRASELSCMRGADLTVVVSPFERELLAKEAPELRVTVISNVHELRGRRRGFAERAGLLFVGGFQHPPNVDAARWLVEEILPRVRRERPEIELHLVGSKAPPEVRALGERPGVRFHGYVPELEPLLDGCRIALAPLRYGAGVKGKINQAMASGLPVVATPMAAEGMALRDGEDVLIAEDVEGFARAILRLYQDEALWTRLSDAGLANVERHFSFAAARAALAEALGLADPESG